MKGALEMKSAGRQVLHQVLHQAPLPKKRIGFGPDGLDLTAVEYLAPSLGLDAAAAEGLGLSNHARVPVQDHVRHHPQELVVLDRPAALVLGVRDNLQDHVRHQHQELVVLDLHGCRRAPLLGFTGADVHHYS